MKMKQFKKLLSLTICIVLIAAMALFTIGCNDNANTTDPVSSGVTQTVTDNEVAKVGEGATQFEFTVVDADGKETKFEVSTDKTTVGEALLDAGLIAGEEGAYGLYVKTVNGTTLDFNTDGKYWAFYVNGEYAMSGVDTTDIVSGETYSFKAE